MSFTIENNVPMAGTRGGRGRKPTAFPFADMGVGQSFLIPCEMADKKIVDSWRRKLLVAKKRFNEQYSDAPWEFRTALVAGGLRVWRSA